MRWFRFALLFTALFVVGQSSANSAVRVRGTRADPKKGTVVKCTAAYDNSAGNPNNPDPSKQITWGQQSWDEMMIGFFTAVRPMEP